MHTLLTVCQLCLLLLVIKTLAQDHRLRTPEGDEHRVRRKPKWSHFFVMHEPRSEEKDKAQGFFYQVGSGPPVINRLRSSPPGFQSQPGGSNMARYSPVLHSPYPNQPQPQQFGSRVPDSFGQNLPNPLFNKPQSEDPAGGILNSEIPPDNTQNFQSDPQGISKQQNLSNAPLQLDPGTLGDADSKSGTDVLGHQGPVSSHTTLLLQGNPQHGAAPDDSTKDSLVPIQRKPSFVVGGQSLFGKRNPLPSHLTPIIPPAAIELDGKTNKEHGEREKLRLSIAQHIPTRTGNTLPVLDRGHPESSGPGLSRPDSIAVTLLDPNRESHLGAEIPKAQIAAGNGELRERQITIDVPNQNGPEIKSSIDSEGNLEKTQQPAEIGRQSGTSAWQLHPRLNPISQEDTSEIFFQDPGNGREREPISHDFTKPPYQAHGKESNLPHLSHQKYNYLPVSQQHAQANNAYHPPSLVNFNTNIHLHGGAPASPSTDLQQERPNQPSHSLSIHPYVLQNPESDQRALQKDVQTYDTYSGRIPSSQIYILRPPDVPELPVATAGHQNGPYRQDNTRHFGGEANSQTPSHLTAIFPVSLGHPKENVGQTVPQNIFSSNANQRAPNIEYPDVLLRNQPQEGVVPSVNPPNNIGTHSIRLLLPQQQLPPFSPTNVPSVVPRVPGAPNRFQTHQVNLLPNSHGYVQTQVQLPPLNFRFQLTPVKDDSNGSFGDSSDSQKIGQPNFQPIPYQYQLPLQPVPIDGTHQILFPNLQVANVPQGTPSLPSDEGQEGATTAPNGLPEKPVTGPPVVKDTVDETKTLKDQTISKDDIPKSTKESGSVITVTDNESDVEEKGKLLETDSLPNDIPVKEDTAIKSFTPDEGKTEEEPTTESENSDIQLPTNESKNDGIQFGSDEKEEVAVPTVDGTSLELTTKSQIPSTKPSLDLLSVLTFTEAPKTEDSDIKIIDDAKIAGDTKVGEEEKGVTASGDSLSVSADDSGDGSSSDLSTTDSKSPSTVTTIESTTLKQPIVDLADERSSELPATVSEVPTTVSTRESTTLEQSTVDLADKSRVEVSTTTSEAPTTVSTTESTTSETSPGDLADKSSGELSTTTSEASTTVSTRESTTLEQSTVDLSDKSSSTLTTEASETPATVSTSQSTTSEQDRTSTTEKELITDGVSESSGLPRITTGEDSIVPDTTTESITSTAPEDTLLTTTNVPSSTDVTTVTVVGINDISSTSKEAEIVTELSETTSSSTVSVLPSSSEAVPTTPAQDAASDSAAETSVSVTEPSTTKLPTEIVTTASTSPATAEDSPSSDQPSQTQPDLSTPISMLGELEPVTTTLSSPEPDQMATEVLQSQTSTGSPVVTTIKETASLPDLSSTTAATTSDIDSANEIEKFVTSPAQESSSTKIPVTTGSSVDKVSIFNQISVFTFTEGPINKRKTEKPNGEATGVTPKDKLDDNKTKIDNKSVSVSKDTEVSLNEIFVVPTTTNAVDGTKDKEEEEENKHLRDGVVKDVNETSLEPELKTTKRPEDRAIFTFVGKDTSKTAEEITEFSLADVTPSTSVSIEDSKVATFTEKDAETTVDNKIPVSTPSTETELNQNQGRSVGGTDLKNQTSDDARGSTEVSNGRERNENEVAEVENGRSSNRNSGAEVLSDTEVTGLDDKSTKDTSEKEQTSTATIESQNPSTFNSEIPESSDSGSSVISDSQTSTESRSSDPSVMETTTDDSGNSQVTDTPMLIDNDALELLLNNLVTPRNISFLSPVTSTSISIAIGIPSESPEQVLDENLSENNPTGQNNNVLGAGNSTAVKNEVHADETNLPESDSGSSFFSKVFGKSLLPFDNNNNNQNSPEGSLQEANGNKGESQTISTEKEQSETNQSSSPSTIEAPSSDSVTSASVSPETEEPVPDRSSVKLAVLDNFEGKDVPDFTEILNQHAR